MRLVQGRGYWEARHRIESLSRFAFLGDSYVFGPGVGAAETLPARAERHLNEAAGGRLFEAVNLGVNGYNLWNAWLSFKRMPQVYDGVVLSICSNDAQLLELTLRVDYAGKTVPYWDANHPFRGAIENCFDDIAAFGAANKLPVAVCFYTLWPPQGGVEWLRKLSDVIAALCTARDIPYIDFPAHLTERAIDFAELVLDTADFHPSKLAHDAAARHLVLTLRGKGWLEGTDGLAQTPGKILSVLHDLIEKETYPRDVALRWADAALAAKRTAARRSTPIPDDFSVAADAAAHEIAVSHQHWQADAKTAAVLAQASALKEGISLSLNAVEDDILRLEEFGYVLGRSDRQAIVDALPAPPQRGTPAPILTVQDAGQQLRSVVDDMNNFAAAAGSSDADAVAILDFAGRTKRKAEDTLGFLTDLSPLLEAADETEDGPASLLREIVGRATTQLDTVRRKLAWTQSIAPSFDEETTVDVTLATNTIEGRHPGHIAVWVGSAAPRRPPMKNQRQFLNTGEAVLIRLKLPLFYAGQLMVLIQFPAAVAARATAELVSLDVYNSEGPRRSFARDAFTLDSQGRLVSPNAFLV